MYEIISLVNGTKIPEEYFIKFPVACMERALALASMLQKISTPEVSFGGIIVEPANLSDHETSKRTSAEPKS